MPPPISVSAAFSHCFAQIINRTFLSVFLALVSRFFSFFFIFSPFFLWNDGGSYPCGWSREPKRRAQCMLAFDGTAWGVSRRE